MRMPRRRYLVALLLAVATGLFFHFSVFYHVKGRLRGDAYYKGMPTNWWADCLNGDHGTPKWLKSVYDFLGARPFNGFEGHEVLSADPDATGVLLQLAADPANSPNLREKAINRLHAHHKESASELANVCAEIFTNEKEDEQMRLSLIYTLMKLAEDHAADDFDFTRQLRSDNPRIRASAAGIMWAQGKDCGTIGPLLVSMIENYAAKSFPQDERQIAINALASYSNADAIPFLLEATHNSDKWVRWAATYGIRTWLINCCKLGPDQEPLKSALARLRVLANDADPEVCRAAARALESAKLAK